METTTTTRTIAGLTFSNEGIVITRPYNDNPEAIFNNRPKEDVYTGKWLDLAKRLAKYRMASCYRKLHTNLAQATHITPDMIAWKDGRFTVGVWDALNDILSLNDVRKLTRLQTQQLIRARLFDKSGNWLYDHDESWNETREGDIYMDEGFILFLTEHILCCEDSNI